MSDLRKRQHKLLSKNGDDTDTHNTGKPTTPMDDRKFNCKTVALMLIFLVTMLIFFYIAIVPSPIAPVAVLRQYPLPRFDGVMSPNEILKETTPFGKGKLQGPESLQVDSHGNIYTGLVDGRIVKVEKSSGNIVVLARTGDDLPYCGKDKNLEDQCGRPLGLHLDTTEERLFICDAYKGLFYFHFPTNTLTTLLPASSGVGGVPFKLLNSVVLSSEDVLYFTDSSLKWSRRDFIYLMLEGTAQGRLMSFDLKTREASLILDGLFFANGVALSPDEDFVLCVETGSARILRHWLKGEKKGRHDIFADNLPGFPDNIRNAHGGGYWIGFATKREHPFSLLDAVGPYPRIKSFFAKVVPRSLLPRLAKPYGLIVKIDENGALLESYHDTSGQVISHISEVLEKREEGVLYLGSYTNNFLGMLKLNSSILE